MSAHCHVCGFDLPYEGDCSHCDLRAENERLRADLAAMRGVPRDEIAERVRLDPDRVRDVLDARDDQNDDVLRAIGEDLFAASELLKPAPLPEGGHEPESQASVLVNRALSRLDGFGYALPDETKR